jgi:hypothetical protein
MAISPGGLRDDPRVLADFLYTRQELDALVQTGQAPIVGPEHRHEQRTLWVTRWCHTYTPPERMGSFGFHEVPAPRLWVIETGEGYTLADLLQELGRLELQALGYVKYGQEKAYARTFFVMGAPHDRSPSMRLDVGEAG